MITQENSYNIALNSVTGPLEELDQLISNTMYLPQETNIKILESWFRHRSIVDDPITEDELNSQRAISFRVPQELQ